jgi:hypothetical protein
MTQQMDSLKNPKKWNRRIKSIRNPVRLSALYGGVDQRGFLIGGI